MGNTGSTSKWFLVLVLWPCLPLLLCCRPLVDFHWKMGKSMRRKFVDWLCSCEQPRTAWIFRPGATLLLVRVSVSIPVQYSFCSELWITLNSSFKPKRRIILKSTLSKRNYAYRMVLKCEPQKPKAVTTAWSSLTEILRLFSSPLFFVPQVRWPSA